ncbi:MAG TPA: glycoside hydrolase family 15 protein, partial [Acidimicrobiales bacterium]|nr:glycoside hydrolase family 15 protein [Acidimicrobiales bacterium]
RATAVARGTESGGHWDMGSIEHPSGARRNGHGASPLLPPVIGSNAVGGVLVPGVNARDPLERRFPPIADYAFLSDCETNCLVAPSGAIEWLCLPAPHDPSLFGAILDRSAGSFRLGPSEATVPADRHYVPGTMVLATTWQTRGGWIVVHDFLAVGPWARTASRADHYRRTPRDFDARHVLVRTATCIHGTVDVVLDCVPSLDYGREDARWAYKGASYTDVVTTNASDVTLTLSGDMRFGIEGRSVRARRRLSEGESIFAALSWADGEAPADADAAERYLGETSRFWRNWIDGGKLPQHPWREHLQRSALTLKGLTYAPTGALLAAATTSLPENLGGSRNWDYRFTWIRDTAFALRALHSLGFETEADDFLNFLGDVLEPRSRGADDAPDPRMQVLYPVDGSANEVEIELDHLTGYAASRPVRVGNAAFDQTQIDIYGAIVDCIFEHARSRDTLTARSWRIVMRSVEAALESWRAPDRGIWEMRGEEKHFTFSKVMCWVAADRGARLAQMRGDRERSARWRSAADEIHADICENGVNEEGIFVQYYGSDEMDASLLQLPMLGFLPLDDERLRATVFEIDNLLADGAYVYRYEVHDTDDGLRGEPEHTFTACSFWLVSAYVMIGELDLARSHCEKLIGAASKLDLYAEELDPVTLRHLGNFPQALTHLALINAVLRVITAENEFNETLGATASHQRWWLSDAGDSKIVGPGDQWPSRGGP